MWRLSAYSNHTITVFRYLFGKQGKVCENWEKLKNNQDTFLWWLAPRSVRRSWIEDKAAKGTSITFDHHEPFLTPISPGEWVKVFSESIYH